MFNSPYRERHVAVALSYRISPVGCDMSTRAPGQRSVDVGGKFNTRECKPEHLDNDQLTSAVRCKADCHGSSCVVAGDEHDQKSFESSDKERHRVPCGKAFNVNSLRGRNIAGGIGGRALEVQAL